MSSSGGQPRKALGSRAVLTGGAEYISQRKIRLAIRQMEVVVRRDGECNSDVTLPAGGFREWVQERSNEKSSDEDLSCGS